MCEISNCPPPPNWWPTHTVWHNAAPCWHIVVLHFSGISLKALLCVLLLLCVFIFRPAIWFRTFWFIESVLSTSWVLVSTPCFFLFAGHDKAGKTKRGYLFTGQMCFILFAISPSFFPFLLSFLFLIFFFFWTSSRLFWMGGCDLVGDTWQLPKWLPFYKTARLRLFAKRCSHFNSGKIREKTNS